MHDGGQTGDPGRENNGTHRNHAAANPSSGTMVSVVRLLVIALFAAGCALVEAPAAGPLVTVEATGGQLPRGNVPERRRHRSRRARPPGRTGRDGDPPGDERVDRRPPDGDRHHGLRGDPVAAVPRDVPDRVRRPGAGLHGRDGARPGADRVVRRRGRPAGTAVRGDPLDPRREPARAERRRVRDTSSKRATLT